MRWIIGSSLKARRLVVVLAGTLLVVGIVQVRSMPADVLPEFAPPTVELQTEALGLSAVEVEQLITVPLEQDLLNGVAFLDEIRSASVAGLSSIQMIFEPGTDLLDARQVVQERLTQAHALPNVSKPPQMLQPLSSTSRVMMISLPSDELSTIDLSILARWTIGPRLLGVPGVANVAVWGNQDRQLQVLVDPERLRASHVTLQQIIDTTANAQFVCPLSFVECSTPGTGGIIETASQRFGIQHESVFATPEDLAQVPVEGVEGRQLVLGDVAEIVVDHQPLIGDSVGPNLLLVVEKFPSANTLEVTSAVDGALDSLRPGLSGVEIDTTLYRPATYIEDAKANLTTALVIGAVLALLVLGAVLFDWRMVSVSVITILVSLATAGLVLSLTDATLNAMVVAGLVLALIVVVDDAVIDAENFGRRIRERREVNGATNAKAIFGAALEMRGAAACATVIILVSLVPTFFTGGTFGAFFPSIAFSYAVAVVASMLVALIITPGLALWMSKATHGRHESTFARWLRPRYAAGLTRILGSPRPAYLLMGLVVVTGLIVAPFLTRPQDPSFEDPNVLVHLSGAPGTSLAEMQRVSVLMRDELGSIPGVAEVGAHVGRAVLSDQVVGSDAGQLWVTIDPGADHDATLAAIEDVAAGYPGLDTEVTNYPKQRIGEVLPALEEPVVVRVYGQDLDILQGEAERVRQTLSETEGVVDPRLELPPLEAAMEIEVDLGAAQQENIKPGDVRRAATTLISGIVVGSLFEEQKVFEVVVWGAPATRSNLTDIDRILVDTPDGEHVRLGDVADVRIAPSPTAVRHEAVSRYIDVVAGVSGREVGDVLTEVGGRLGKLQFPLEYHAEVLRDSVERQATDRRAIGLVVGAVLVMFLVLQAGVGSWRVAALASVMMPLALVGAELGALFAGGDLSLGAIGGAFAVLGIAARQVVVMIRHFQHLERKEGETFGAELVLRGGSERLTPILASASATVVAFVPVVILGDIGGLELVYPMALVVLGGLAASTLLTLFVVPSLYLRFGQTRDAEQTEVSMDRLIDLTQHEDGDRDGREEHERKELIGGGR